MHNPLYFELHQESEENLQFYPKLGTFAVVALLVRGATSEISDGLIYDKLGNQTHVSDLFTRGQVATGLSAVVGIFQVSTNLCVWLLLCVYHF